MTVKYFATIRTYTGETARRLEGAPPTLGELLAQLAQRYGAPFRHAVLTGDDALGEAVIILVNGRNVVHLRGLETPLADDDEVSIFPLVAGG